MRFGTARFWSWIPPMPLLTRPSHATLSPEAQQLQLHLHRQLLQTVVVAMVLFKVPLDMLITALLWYDIWVLERHPPAVYILHILNLISVVLLMLTLLRQQRANVTLALIIIITTINILCYIWFTGDIGPFFTIILVMALPAIAMPARITALIMISICSIFIAMVQLEPHLSNENLVAILLLTITVVTSFATIGVGVRRMLDYFAVLINKQANEAAERARLAEHSRILEEQHHRLLSAQHDLRAPCNTAIRIVQILRDPTVPETTAQTFIKRLEPILIRLRSRIDSMVDEAKAPATAQQKDWPVIDVAAVIANHLPELDRWASISSSDTLNRETRVYYTQTSPCFIAAREGEIQRILENLVLNSVAADAQRIDIKIRRTDTNYAEIVVHDDGHGFPVWLLAQPLHPSYDLRAHGFGLGLAGVAANVVSFNGTIELTNAERGAQVRIQFPCVEERKDGGTHYRG